jgi:hypothetical protein
MELNMTPAAEHTSGVPDAASSTEVVAVAKRRKFTMAYMQRIVRELTLARRQALLAHCCAARAYTAHI